MEQGELFESVEASLSDTCEGLDEAYHKKLWKEFDRLRGLLRFKPVSQKRSAGGGEAYNSVRYIARCAPDYFVLPLLADHFFLRFGGTPWAIIDEKRRLVLSCDPGKRPVLTCEENRGPPDAGEWDDWEKLWKNYFHSINNENRNKPQLQKQFLPRRYWKYLTEFTDKE
jgi:probable DNA metabolism protein